MKNFFQISDNNKIFSSLVKLFSTSEITEISTSFKIVINKLDTFICCRIKKTLFIVRIGALLIKDFCSNLSTRTFTLLGSFWIISANFF